MADFACPPVSRDQLVLFPERLDEIVPQSHSVRLLDDILCRIDWSNWEALYVLERGQPPIHPRVIAGAIFLGLLNRIRSSRKIEEALEVRNDFRWLVSGQTIDHTTICNFRQKHSSLLKELFIQICLVARELGHLKLATLGFDGTRVRASNRKTGTRTREELLKTKAELAKRFTELESQAAAEDKQDNQQLGKESDHRLPKSLADVAKRQKQVEAALAELKQIEEEGLAVPKRLPFTDPECRVTPCKEGGFAPNYTPTATVDIDSGLIVSASVISHTNEDHYMMAAVEDVKTSFGLDKAPAELLADGMMCTGENIAKCKEMGIDFYAPSKSGIANNPAMRPKLNEPVADADIDGLPTKTTKHRDGTTSTKFAKEAFVYDAGRDSYWCPAGKELPFVHSSKESNRDGRERFHHKSNRADCAACPLKNRCLTGQSTQREIRRDQHEAHRQAHHAKMAKAESKSKYAKRRHAGERPFAMIKFGFGLRTFLTRGKAKVSDEWLWACGAFNLHRLITLIRTGLDPPQLASTT